MKEGYDEEYKATCLGLSLAVVAFSPDLARHLSAYLPEAADAGIGFIACYAAFLALIYAAGIAIDGIVPYSIKDWLLYPTFKGRGLKRPRCRIFADIGCGKAKDFRFELSTAKKLYHAQIATASKKSAADSAQYQNAEWYKLYGKHSASSSVKSNNLGHLYSRDVFTLSFAMLILCAVYDMTGALLGALPPVSIVSISCIATLAVISWISARSKAKRLVLTVIARDIAENAEG